MNDEALKWLPADFTLLLSQKDVHVWRALLDVNEHHTQSLLALLSPDEAERAMRFHFEKDQKRFVAARGILRQILGRYLGVHPAEICFEYTSYGKPFIADNTGKNKLNFNLSHSGDYALYVFTLARQIGIDIEQMRNEVAVEQIAERFFSKNERLSLDAVGHKHRPELFFQYWCRKEAFIKAIGEGVSFPLEQCDISKVNGSSLSPVILANNLTGNSRWYVQDLFPRNGYAAAIVVEGKDCEFSYWDYTR